MSLNVVIGTQWGDEGKGHIVDIVAESADYVTRFGGGDNAGHTVTIEDKTFKLHLIPSGIIRPKTIGVLGNGMVINPSTLIKEIGMLKEAGINITPDRLMIAFGAHLITPGHCILDRAQDESLGKGKIGTTGRGIGPAYVDKSSRRGLRAIDTLDTGKFREKLTQHFEYVNRQLQMLFNHKPLDTSEIMEEYLQDVDRIRPYIHETGSMLRAALLKGKRIMAEGAQGTLLDLDHGSYPYVTSSTTIAPGIFHGLGIGICKVDRVIGVTKAFQTRVGAGPFPTEEMGEMVTRLRGTGSQPWDEFGTTTGRPRRVGWLDCVLLKYAVEINGVTEIMLTKMDILTGLPEIPVCIAYQYGNQTIENPAYGLAAEQLAGYKPLYDKLPSWREDISRIRNWKEMPEAALNYIKKIESLTGVPVSMVSVGPERSQVILRN